MSPVAKKQKVKPSNPLILQVISLGAPNGHWTHPDDRSREFNKLETWIEFAKTAERGKLNAIFIADHLALFDSYDGPHNFRHPVQTGHFSPRVDPSAFVSAMAAATESIGFGITFSTFTEHPYHFARRLATLDDASNGRVAWNIVTSFLKSVGRQLDTPFLEHDERYRKASEYLDVVYKLLLSSWSDDAVEYNKETGVFANPDRVREIDHKGEYFNVPGPAITEPTPQRFPVIFQAGTSDAGIVFAAENAEMIFVSRPDKPGISEGIAKIRKIAEEQFGRDPYSIKIIAGATFHVGKTHEEAVAKLRKEKEHYPDLAKAVGFSGISGFDISKYDIDDLVDTPDTTNAIKTSTNSILHGGKKTKREILDGYDRSGLFVGTPQEIGDQVEAYASKYDIDGFNIGVTIYPHDLNDVVDYVVPELQKRGLFWKDYAVPGGTLRQNNFGRSFLKEDHPAYGLRWKKGESQEKFEKRLSEIEKKRRVNRKAARDVLGLSAPDLESE